MTGAALIRIVQRALFWLIRPLQNANKQLVIALEEQARANDEILKVLERTLVELEVLRASVPGPHSASAGSDVLR
jgi:hypothetical protein